jgi:hypothetical protein
MWNPTVYSLKRLGEVRDAHFPRKLRYCMNLPSTLSSQNASGIGPDRDVCDAKKIAAKACQGERSSPNQEARCLRLLSIIPRLSSKLSSDGTSSGPVSSFFSKMKPSMMRLEKITRS